MITELDKAIVAAVMAMLSILTLVFGFNFAHITEGQIVGVLALLTPVFVWLVPNKAPAPPTQAK
jgi:purine-cytosine permease-like protein